MSLLGIYLVFSIVVLYLTFVALLGHGLSKKENLEIILGVFGIIIFGIMFCHAVSEYHEPKAMDVYQGKTTLEYTMRDGVVIDSVVIYKDEMKK